MSLIKKSLLVIVVTGVIGMLVLIFSPNCNSYSGLVPIREQRCQCLGVVWNIFPREAYDDGSDADQCIGFILNKTHLDTKEQNLN